MSVSNEIEALASALAWAGMPAPARDSYRDMAARVIKVLKRPGYRLVETIRVEEVFLDWAAETPAEQPPAAPPEDVA